METPRHTPEPSCASDCSDCTFFPLIQSYSEAEEDKENKGDSENRAGVTEPSEFLEGSGEDDVVPTFMKLNGSLNEALLSVLDEIFAHHRCRNCARFLCCSGTAFHDVNCWYYEFRGMVDWEVLKDIHCYRFEVYGGSMSGWEEYAYAAFDKVRHATQRWMPHTYGFYVRCFACVVCKYKDNHACHAVFHDHEFECDL